MLQQEPPKTAAQLAELGWHPEIIDRMSTWDDHAAAQTIADAMHNYRQLAEWMMMVLGNTPACLNVVEAIAAASEVGVEALYRRFDKDSDGGGRFDGYGTDGQPLAGHDRFGKPIPEFTEADPWTTGALADVPNLGDTVELTDPAPVL